MITVWMTTSCNLNCRYCYEGDRKSNTIISVDTIDALTKWISIWMEERNISFEQIRFHGGEPTLALNQIKYLINRLENMNYEFEYGMTTNAYRLSDEDAVYIATTIHDLWVSVDGKKITNDENRILSDGRGSFERVIKNLRKIWEINKNIGLRMTVTSNNVTSLYENVSYLTELGYKKIAVAIDIWDKNWNCETLDRLNQECSCIRDKITNDVIDIGLPIEKNIKCRKCTGGIDGVNVYVDGKIYPCTYTVGEGCLSCGDVWNGINPEKVHEFETLYETKLDECTGCDHYDFCSSVRCKFVNWKYWGDYYKPIPVLCVIQNYISDIYK